MSTYAFKAIDPLGQHAKGEVDAESKQSVADQLKAKGLIVLDIAEKGKGADREIELPFRNRIKIGDLAILSRQLATMVSSGMTILRALYVLEAQTENKNLAAELVEVRKDVEAGLPLSDALERHPKTFSPLFIAMTRAGETGGLLEDSLLRIADQLEKEESLRRQVKSAMAYPIVIFVFATAVMLGMVAFIVPVFAGVFKELGNAKLPAMTSFVMGISHIVTAYWYLLFLGAVGGGIGFAKWKKTPKGRAVWQRFLLRVPFKIGDIFQKVALARWSRTFSALMGAGVPLLQAIDITSQTAGNIVVEEAMANVTTSVKAGGTIAQPLMESPVFPSMVGHMVKVGEETGALTTMLSKIGDFYEDQVEASVKALTSILEPVMIVFVGGIVGFIVISMYLPLFSVYDQIK